MRMRQAIGLSLALWAVSGLAMAKQTVTADDRQHQPQSVKTKSAKADHPAARHAADSRRTADAAAADRRHEAARHRVAAVAALKSKPSAGPIRHIAAAAPPDRVTGPASDVPPVKGAGHQQIGLAAWYGGKHVGQRTASGALLDDVTPTAAHRSLPLNSLVRITNVRNGRSVICTINDRGPWGRHRLIDVSPRAADELGMKGSGIAKVSVEPVGAAHPNPD